METARIDMRSEIAGVDFGSKRLDERFKKTMESLSKEPGKSIWLSSGNRSEAKAGYRMLSNEKMSDVEIMRQTGERTAKANSGKRLRSNIGGSRHDGSKLRRTQKDCGHGVYQRQNIRDRHS